VVDWPLHLRLLAGKGYDGVISIETHYKGDGDGEPATRACAIALQAMLGQAG
jgi:sugar phosphate isomerase/epimerase